MNPIVIAVIVLILLIFLLIFIPIAIHNMRNARAKRIAKEILREGQILNFNYWGAINRLNKMQKHDLESGDLLTKLQRLKESQEAK